MFGDPGLSWLGMKVLQSRTTTEILRHRRAVVADITSRRLVRVQGSIIRGGGRQRLRLWSCGRDRTGAGCGAPKRRIREGLG